MNIFGHTAGVETVLAAFSAAMTTYFWLVKSRSERPNLKFFQLGNFRATLRRGNSEQKAKRLCPTQLESGGVLAANDSSRQNSIIRFDCYLKENGQSIKGDWGWTADDKPPWNIPPGSTISLSPACFFDVPEDYETPEDLAFRVEFIAVNGQRFAHNLSLKAPQL